MAIKSKDKIYFDTDCLSTFLCTDSEWIPISLYGNRMVVPTPVLEELKKVNFLYGKISNMMAMGIVQKETFSIESDTFKLFTLLKSGTEKLPKIGLGEASVIALAKCNEATMASNNLKDVAYYINYYKLNNITSADILKEALEKNIIIKSEGERLWQKMRARNRKMPYDTFEEFLNCGR